MIPQFKSNGARIVYALCRRLYFIFFFSCFPCVFVLAFLSELSIDAGILGFWLPFLFLSLSSLPIFVCLLLLGVFINHILCITTGTLPKKEGIYGIVMYSLTLLCVLLTFASAIMYTGNHLDYLALIGVCVFCAAAALLFVACHAKLKRKVRSAPPPTPEFEKKISVYRNVLTLAVVVTLLLSFLFVFYKTERQHREKRTDIAACADRLER